MNQASELPTQASEPGIQAGELKTQAGLHSGSQNASPSRFLQAREVEMIDEALNSLGDYGEVRLIIERGRLRFLITQRSFDTHKWRPGSISRLPRK